VNFPSEPEILSSSKFEHEAEIRIPDKKDIKGQAEKRAKTEEGQRDLHRID
jgi:hypothetical protein